MSQEITAIDLIRRSMYLINAVAAGEIPDDADLNDALLTLNEMLDSWDLQSLVTYAAPNETKVLTPGQVSYSWGVSAGPTGITSARPVFLNNVTCVDEFGNTSPVEVITQEQYDSIQNKALPGNRVTQVLYIKSFPLGQLICYPVPTKPVTLTLGVGRQIDGPVALHNTISLPPGYLRAIRYNLAVEMWPEYTNTTTDIESVKRIAKDALGRVKAANNKVSPSTFESIPGVGVAGWSDEYHG